MIEYFLIVYDPGKGKPRGETSASKSLPREAFVYSIGNSSKQLRRRVVRKVRIN